MSHITSIVYKPKDLAIEGDYVRVPLDSARLIAGYGIEDDAKGGESGRHLNILSAESVAEMILDGYKGDPGAFGEQIVVMGIDVDSLVPGDRLRLGQSAVVEIGKARNGCAKLEANQGMPRDRTAGKLGVMAEVVENGDIHVGDAVAIVAER